jgi:tRNA(Ile)-lysidine synthase
MPRAEATDIAGTDDSLNHRCEDALDILAPYSSVLLAVSGGPDSVALMLLCAQWSLRRTHAIAVATIDHRLRKESRSEADEVGRWARALGFEHHLLTWQDEKPQTRLQERARQARYALLTDCARRIGASAIVLAHHSDDQAETILFRLTRGSGVAGLAGMAQFARYDDLACVRPLLDFSKEELEAICEQAKHPFFRDPSNEDESFARVRLRKLAPILAAQGLTQDALLRLGSRAARADAALTHCAVEALNGALRRDDETCVDLDPAILREAPIEILLRVLAIAIKRLAPDAVLRLERLERASARVAAALTAHRSIRTTLADISIEANDERIRLRHAPPRRSS